jgi:hypothetical protein
MNVILGTKAPVWLRIVAILGLLWNLFGCYAYLQTVGALPGGEAMAASPMPAWVTGAFAISTFGGALGCVGLLMLMGWSRLLLVISLLAVLAQDVWAFGLANAPAEGGPVLPIVVNLIAIGLAWVAHDAGKKGWLT